MVILQFLLLLFFCTELSFLHGNSDSFCVREEQKSQLGVCSLSFPSMPSCHITNITQIAALIIFLRYYHFCLCIVIIIICLFHAQLSHYKHCTDHCPHNISSILSFLVLVRRDQKNTFCKRVVLRPV